MTVGEMLGLTDRFKEIISFNSAEQGERLANLMTDMEVAYDIPILNNESFNKRNPFVIAMYRTISNARFEREGDDDHDGKRVERFENQACS